MGLGSFFKNILAQWGVELGLVLCLVTGFYYFNSLKNPQAKVAESGRAPSPLMINIENIQRNFLRADDLHRRFLGQAQVSDLDQYNLLVIQINSQMAQLNQLSQGKNAQKNLVADFQKALRTQMDSFHSEMMSRQGVGGGNKRFVAQTAEATQAEMKKIIAQIATEDGKSIFSSMPHWSYTLAFGLGLLLIFASRILQSLELSDEREKNRRLYRRSAVLDTILSSMSDGLVVTDEKGRFTHYNAAAQKIIGTKVKEIYSVQSAEAIGFHDEATKKILMPRDLPFDKALHGETREEQEIFVRNELHPEGLFISLTSHSLHNIRGGISGAIVVFRDMSRRRQAEQDWIAAREAALEASRKKSDFLAAMSHEIRTPMNGVIGMTTLLADTKLDPEQKDYVGTIKRSAESLLRLINDILDHSKIEAGKIRLDPQPFDLNFLVRDVSEIFRPLVQEKNITLDISMEGREGEKNPTWFFHGDTGRLRQILTNLIGNAVKFTENGGVQLKIQNFAGVDGRVRLKFEVRDSGPGMREDERQSLFQKYFQTRTGAKMGGTGLGLSICKQLVDLMGGVIGVDSTLGAGSNFWFSVELPVCTSDELVQIQEVAFSSMFKGTVLIAEDQIVNQRVASAYLQKLGLKVDVVSNGKSALEKIRENRYDLVFMDCQMPVLNGYDATRAIRQWEKEHGGQTPVVALTAEGTSGERKLCFAAGMDDFLTKPLELNRLIEILHRWINPPMAFIDAGMLNKLKDYSLKNRDLTVLLIDDFADSGPELIFAMKAAVQNQDLQALSEAAHALRSTTATLGAQRMAEICAQVEKLTELSSAGALIHMIEEQFDKSLRELKTYLNKSA